MSNFDRCRWDVTNDDERDLDDIKFDLLEEQEQELDIASGFRSARHSPNRDTVTLDNRPHSAPSSPSRISNVQNKIKTFEKFIASNYPDKVSIMSYKITIEKLVKSRNGH